MSLLRCQLKRGGGNQEWKVGKGERREQFISFSSTKKKKKNRFGTIPFPLEKRGVEGSPGQGERKSK